MDLLLKIRTFIKKQIIDIKTRGTQELFRKCYLLTKFFVLILMDIIAIVPCIIIRLLSPWLIIRIGKIPAANFGNFVEMTAEYYIKKKLKIDLPTKRYIDLVYIHYNDKIHNKQLAKMWKRKLNFLSGYLLDPINRVNKFIPGEKIHTIDSLLLYSYDYRLMVNNLPDGYQVLDFTEEEEIYGRKMLNKFGLKDKDKFVCLVVRDKAYQQQKIPERYRDWSYHDFRHTNINKFVLAAEELTKRGYYVFRMGVVVEKPFNSSNPKIIDYANSNLRSDFMDIYLGAKCSFCISTGTGYQELPCLFRKPMVMMENPLGTIYTHNEKYLLMTKHHILKKEKRRLSLSEIFSYGVAYAYDTKTFEQKGIELVENTSEEIKDIVLEMVDNLEYKKKLNPEDEELQKTFRNLYASNVKRFDYLKESKHYRSMIIHAQIKSRYGTKFLRENKDWLR